MSYARQLLDTYPRTVNADAGVRCGRGSPARRHARLDAQPGSQIDPASPACRRRPARSIALLGWALGSAAASPACQCQPLGSLQRCALKDHPEPERRKLLRVDQRTLHGLQIVPCQHPGEIGTAGLK